MPARQARSAARCAGAARRGAPARSAYAAAHYRNSPYRPAACARSGTAAPARGCAPGLRHTSARFRSRWWRTRPASRSAPNRRCRMRSDDRPEDRSRQARQNVRAAEPPARSGWSKVRAETESVGRWRHRCIPPVGHDAPPRSTRPGHPAEVYRAAGAAAHAWRRHNVPRYQIAILHQRGRDKWVAERGGDRLHQRAQAPHPPRVRRRSGGLHPAVAATGVPAGWTPRAAAGWRAAGGGATG